MRLDDEEGDSETCIDRQIDTSCVVIDFGAADFVNRKQATPRTLHPFPPLLQLPISTPVGLGLGFGFCSLNTGCRFKVINSVMKPHLCSVCSAMSNCYL